MATVVKTTAATKSFGEREVLAPLELEVNAGEVVGVIGPNGGGKSTLLMMMAGLLEPSSGTVTVCGIAAHKLALQSAGRVGLVMARPGLYPLLTGRENLEYFGGLFGLSRDEVRSKGDDLLRRFDLAAHMDQRLSTWSTGMQQKLSLVRALLLNPDLLLFDEPAANLDPLAAQTLYDELRERADDGLACVLVTHNLVAAESKCDRVWLINGRLVEEIAIEPPEPPAAGPLMLAWQRMEAGA